MKNTKIIAAVVMIFALLSLLVITLDHRDKEPSAGFLSHRIVAHAMGGVNGHAYTNTLEAFVANYEQGTRVFEADLMLTSDDQLVARHEWSKNMSRLLGQQTVLPAAKQGAVLEYAQFMNSPILDIYSPLDIEKILDLMQAYPDAYIVTDTKEIKPELVTQQFTLLTEAAERRDPALLERVVPQIYSQDMLDVINKVHVFPEVLYTLYQSQDSDEQVIDFAKESGVDITMPSDRATKSFVQKLKKAGVRVYVNTVNEENEIVELSRLGVDGFYTDFVSEEDLSSFKGLR
ncbi:phosphatidylinositol-specific phospholipase C/glycerophosphodiester phosphodiesterase family protein [Paenibacillus graminis]|uniref:phosphatidylinositol-specific phospholipase C/glycerophosphodiester phosphodiesterase family protein n=1 Tax=Paenibacillus graminis TaxID=189425 RepID=UPI002DBDE943|nr:phosphatidylinositol-specific phospholipase C/glycerophosphodiester phosphodiesterase family protein [Paenibacillus graminis]MEC0171181.1 phosphatidylinositol-specific phospholipase C/glycerophosphodiester phosphodiesterase family protein [Paenibacillus graminis]